ncbi:MAG: SDR family oxidoreductase [Phycisphaerales bacterium]|jgi:3-oxoacyl-[acyl-carrier protein] reductase
MNLDLTGRRALVCGSNQGIGKACADQLAAQGATITLLGRNESGLQAALPTLPTPKGQTHDMIVADLTHPAAAGAAVASALRADAPWEILINNTGGPPAGTTLDATETDLLAAFNAQLLAAHALVKLLVPGFRARGFGRIINITSTSIKQPIPGLAISNIIRPAVAAWAKGLATELGPLGVTVNNVLPGYTSTERLASIITGRAAKAGTSDDAVRQEFISTTPMRRLGEPQDIAAAVGFLASPAAGYISGINLPVDGGRLAVL